MGIDLLLLLWLFPPLLTLLIITTLSTSYYNRNPQPQQRRLPPEADGGWPLLGHLPSLSGGPDLPHVTLSNMAEKHGPAFTIRLGVHRALIVSTWEVAKDCLTSANDSAFSDRPKAAAFRLMGYDFAMFGFCPHGPYWRDMRKIAVQNLLSANWISTLEGSFESQVDGLVRKLYNEESRGEAEMKRAFGDSTLDMMVRVVAGEGGFEKVRDVGGGEKVRETFREFFRLMGVLTLPDVFPFLGWMGLITNKPFKRTSKKMDRILQGWVDEHKRFKGDGFMARMMVAATKVAQDFPEHGADTIVKATCQSVMLGGTELLAVTLTWALSLLLNNPHTMARAQEDLDRHVGRERRVRSSDVQNLPFVRAIITETLRLYAPQPVVTREAAEDCTVAGYRVPAGTHLMVNLWRLHRDPRVWGDDALEFRPERFLMEEEVADVRGQHFGLIPFGSGRRMCPAVSFVLQFTELALASLLQGFCIEKASDEALDITGSAGFINFKATPLRVRLTPRLSPSLYA